MKFTATIEQAGKTATGFEVPQDVVTALGKGKRPPVRVTLNGYTYRTTVGVMAGRSMIPVSGEVRDAAGVAAGDELTVELTLDTEPRDLDMPPDLAAALDPDARAFFDTLSYSRKQRFVLPIQQARTPETRQRNLAKAIAALNDRKPQP